MAPLENIMIVNKGNSGCDYHRIQLPFKYMPDIKQSFRYDKTNLIVFNRLPLEPVDVFLQQRKKHGFKYVVDVDDYWHLYPQHYMFKQWVNYGAPEKIEKIIKNANAITTTNELLYNKIKELAPYANVHIIPNALPFDKEQFKPGLNINDKPTFIYAGGQSHFIDLSILQNPFKLIDQENNWKFILAGIDAKNLEWQRISRLFVGIKNYEHRPHSPINTYMQSYNHADVSLAPLQFNEFNICKSNLKILEAGAKNMMCIASDIPPYKNSTDINVVERCKTVKDWYNKMEHSIKNPSWVIDRGLQLGEHVRTYYNLDKINILRKQLYETLLQ